MERPRPRADMAENLGRFYDAVWRHARATHSGIVYTSWAQLAIACGYEATDRALSRLQGYAALVEEAGLMRVGGEKDHTGAWRRLRIVLLEPSGLLSGSAPVAQLDDRTGICEARRRHETRSQRRSRRHRPWRRHGGRARPGSLPRFDFFWTVNGYSGEPARPAQGTTCPSPGGRALGGHLEAPGSSVDGHGLRDANASSGVPARRSESPRSVAVVAEGSGVEERAPAALRDVCATRNLPSTDRGPSEASLDARSAISDRWASWASAIGGRLAELASLRYPTYADAAEALALVAAGAPGYDVFAEGDRRHARAATRQKLERKAARYDRYAGRLASEGVKLRHPTAMSALIEFYARWPEEACVSPAAPLGKLGGAALRLQEQWNERHPEIKARRRTERLIRQAEQRAGGFVIGYHVEPRLGSSRSGYESVAPEQVWQAYWERLTGDRLLAEREAAAGC